MHGVDRYGYLQCIASRFDQLGDQREIATLLDEAVHLFELPDAELQQLAEDPVAKLCTNLEPTA